MRERERERAQVSKGHRKRENPRRGRGRERNGAHLKWGSSSPHVGLELTNDEIIT